MRTPITLLIVAALPFFSAHAQCPFTFSPNSGICPGEQVIFSATNPQAGLLYQWDLNGDGNPDQQGPSVTYTFPFNTNNQNYQVTLSVDSMVCAMQNILVLGAPDVEVTLLPQTGVVQSGNAISACTGSASVTLDLFNTASTTGQTSGYTINWGDGSATQSFTNANFSASVAAIHTFNGFGFFPITITAMGTNGCDHTEVITFYNGTNPAIGLVNPGGTVGLCAPATIDFPVTNTANNPPGTTYIVYVNNMPVDTFDQTNVPAIYSYTFTESSCGQTTSDGQMNSFELRIVASNPCNSSSATISPIQLSAPPVAGFDVTPSNNGCPDDIFTFNNTTVVSEVQNGMCNTELTPLWSFSPGTAGVEWTIVSGGVVSDQIQVQFNQPGVYTAIITVLSPSCGPSTYSEDIVITTPPTADANAIFLSNPANCVPSVVNFDNLSTGFGINFVWDVSQNDGWNFSNNTNENSENPQITFTEPGTYVVTLATANACDTEFWDTTIVVAGIPGASINPIPPFCETALISPSAVFFDNGDPITSYLWSFPGGSPASSTMQNPGMISYNMPGVYTVSLTIENGCGQQTSTLSFTVQEPEDLTLPAPFSACVNDAPIDLNATPASGQWSGPGISGNMFDPATAGDGDFTLTYSFGSGACTTTESIQVTVNPLPVLALSADPEACESDPAIPLTANPAGGAWTVDNGGVLVGNTFDPQASGPNTYQLTYTFTDAQTGCSNNSSLDIEVFDLPLVLAADTSYCNTPGLVDLPFASPPNGDWSGPGISNNQLDPLAVTSPTSATYTFTDSNGCTDSVTISIDVVNPANVQVGPDTTVCVNHPVIDLSLFSSPPNGSWTVVMGNAGALSGDIFTPANGGDGSYELLYSVGGGNCEVAASLNILVNPLPNINLSGNITALCESADPITLIASPPAGVWTGPGVSGDQFDPAVAGLGDHDLTYAFTDNNQCENQEVLTITVNELPNVVSSDTVYCNTPGLVGLPFASPVNGAWSGTGITGNLFDPQALGGAGMVSATYVFQDGAGCADSTSIVLTVVDPVIPEAGPVDTFCITDAPVLLTGFTPATGGTWSGPGIQDAATGLFDPSQANGGTNVLTYTYGAGNCELSDTKTVFIVDLTGLQAGADESACLLDPPFDLGGANPAGGLWSGPGITNATAGTFNPQQAGVGTWPVTYTLTDGFSGCVFAVDKMVTVHPMPQSAFIVPAEACVGEDLMFVNTSANTFDPAWDFGDGLGSSGEASPTYAYSSPGTFSVSLVTQTEFGCADSVSQDIFVTTPPVAAFQTDTLEGCSVLPVTFNNQSSGVEVTYFWNFGNGDTTSVEEPGTIFFQQGINDTTYTVTLLAANYCATVADSAEITVFPIPAVEYGLDVSTGCTPHTVSFQNLTTGNPLSFFWDLGNGNQWFDTVPPPQTYFTDTVPTIYPITLIALNACGADTLTQEVTVNPVTVEAFFNTPNTLGCEPFTVTFTSFATPGATVTWEFDILGGAPGDVVTFTFEEEGIYEVIQYVTNGCGYDSAVVMIEVLPAPEVSFTHEPAVCQGDSIQFVNTTPGISGVAWDFGDGNTSSVLSPWHMFAQPGTYTVVLTTQSALNGCQASDSSTVLIRPLPEASFSPSEISGCPPFTVVFDNNSTGADAYNWDFGDLNTTTANNPAHTYFQTGVYPVTLLVEDDFGCQDDTTFLSLTIHPVPVAGFSYQAAQLCGVPVEVVFDNQSQGAVGYDWYFGDGGNSVLNNPVHVYQDTGFYLIQLVAENSFLCSDTAELDFRALPQPTADLAFDPAEGCEPLEVVFTEESDFANQWTWTTSDGAVYSGPEAIHVFQQAGTYGISLVVSYDGICFDSLNLPGAILVQPSPVASFTFEEITDPMPSGTFQFYNQSQFAVSYDWDFGDGGTSEEENPQYRFFSNGEQLVTLTATGPNGCQDDTLAALTPSFFKGLFIPNGLSPEYGPPEVRVFQPKGVALEEYRIQVYSGYGDLLWESSLLQDGQPAESWDGTFKGVLLPPDVYIWKVSARFQDGTVWEGMPDESGQAKPFGTILLIR